MRKVQNTVHCQTDIMHMRNTHEVQRKVDCTMRFRTSNVNMLSRWIHLHYSFDMNFLNLKARKIRISHSFIVYLFLIILCFTITTSNLCFMSSYPNYVWNIWWQCLLRENCFRYAIITFWWKENIIKTSKK